MMTFQEMVEQQIMRLFIVLHVGLYGLIVSLILAYKQ